MNVETGKMGPETRDGSSCSDDAVTNEPKPLTFEPVVIVNDEDIWGDEEEDKILQIATQISEAQEGLFGTTIPKADLGLQGPGPSSIAECVVPGVQQLLLRRQVLENKYDGMSRFFGGNDSIQAAAQEKIDALEQQLKSLENDNYRLKGEASIIRRNSEKLKLENQEESKKCLLAENDSKRKVNELALQYQKEVKSYELKLQENRRKLLVETFPAHKLQVEVLPPICNIPVPIKKQQPSMEMKMVQTDVSNHDGLKDSDLICRFTEKELRDDFQKIEQMVELRYQALLSTFERVIKDAPKQIMKRMVPTQELKSAFPDSIDAMFQWELDNERKKVRASKGITESIIPSLPRHRQFESGNSFHEIKMGIEMRFKIFGAWGALMEVREGLQQLLKSLEGKCRFRLYDSNILKNFWRLLFWANELWRCILFQEESEQLVEQQKKIWVTELEGWTGLVLKCDWRDYFVLELEVQVRKLTLNILESIVTAGYFEQKSNRYEILYRVLKDTLSKDAFCNCQNLQRILKIVTWSISDVGMMKHLCYRTNEGNCLAQLIGESLLKVCRQEADSTVVAVLYMDYLHLLDNLMIKKPVVHHHSKFARSVNQLCEQVRVLNPSEIDSEMEYSGTQLACPVRYTKPINAHRVNLSEEDLNYWLDPVKYEDPYSKLKLCQCRKLMMGTAVSVLSIVFKFWRQSYMEYEVDFEARHAEEQEEVERLERAESSGFKQMVDDIQKERLLFLRDKKAFLGEFLPKVNQALGQTSGGDTEWNWDDIIRKGREITTTPLPQWLSDYKRQGNVLDLCISKGIFLMNFLRTRSENLADAIGTEAYKEYIILLSLLRLHMDKLDLNRLDYGILVTLTADLEEDQLKDVIHPESLEYGMEITELKSADCKQLPVTSDADMQNQLSTAEIEDIHNAYYDSLQEKFLFKSGFYQDS